MVQQDLEWGQALSTVELMPRSRSHAPLIMGLMRLVTLLGSAAAKRLLLLPSYQLRKRSPSLILSGAVDNTVGFEGIFVSILTDFPLPTPQTLHSSVIPHSAESLALHSRDHNNNSAEETESHWLEVGRRAMSAPFTLSETHEPLFNRLTKTPLLVLTMVKLFEDAIDKRLDKVRLYRPFPKPRAPRLCTEPSSFDPWR